MSEGSSGVFNYWAGKWNVELDNYLIKSKKNNDGSFIPIPAIEETCYIENQDEGNMIVILNKAENPQGIFKYFIEYSHDGGKGQTLFTRGAEGRRSMLLMIRAKQRLCLCMTIKILL